jgi:hypothetical protein
MRLALEPQLVARPVVKDPEAVRSVDFPELHLDAVIGVTVRSQDVLAPTAGRSQLLGDDPDLAEAQPRRVISKPVLQPDLVVTRDRGAWPAALRA